MFVHADDGSVPDASEAIGDSILSVNLRANTLCPGLVDTPLLTPLPADPAARSRRLVHIPPGRLAQASEIARAALFLASDESSYFHGATFGVDGGITAAYITPE